MRRRPSGDQQFCQSAQHNLAPEPSRDRQGQALPADLVDDRQDPELAAVVGPSLDEVVGPYVAGILRPQPDTRPVIEPEA